MTTPRKRNHKSARQAGTKFERQIANHLAQHLNPTIDRKPHNGPKDTGDIGGVTTTHGHKLTIECKNTTKTQLAQWIKEAHKEAQNDQAITGIIAHKRHGNNNPGEQWITMTLNDLIQILKPH